MKSFIRWSVLICLGLPIQGLLYCLYPIACILWRLFIFKPITTQKIPNHYHNNPSTYKGLRNNDLFLNNNDDHSAFTMYGQIGQEGLSLLLDSNGNFSRRYNEDGSLNMRKVSGDAVVAWCFAASFVETKNLDIKKVADNYLKYLGSRAYDDVNKGDVSNKCNNMGLNYCPDGYLRIGQPTTGPQFYTTSAVFALAYHLGFRYKVIFWLNWLIFGGWYWAFCPVIYTKSNGLFYTRDISMKSLYIHKKIFGNRWWITLPMKFFTYKISEYRNDLFYAMHGHEPLESFPEYGTAWFSQRENATSEQTEDCSPYIKLALMKIAKEAKEIV